MAAMSIISIVTAGLTTYTTVQVALASVTIKTEENDRRITLIERIVIANSAAVAALTAREDGSDRNQKDLQERLKTIDDNVYKLLERSSRR